MATWIRRRLGCVVKLAGAATLAVGLALAGDARASTDLKAAQAAFHAGQRAFRAANYPKAAELFEEAYRLGPHPSTLWNAARARQLAGEHARAANLFAKYLREAPDDAPDRRKAAAALAELRARLGRITVVAKDVTDVTIDGAPIEHEETYVAPGTHLVRGAAKGGGRAISESPSVRSGEAVSVALVVPEEPRPEIARAPARPAQERPKDTPRASGLSPAFVVGGAALTVVAGGLAVWSGLDVESRKDRYLEGERTQEAYDDGKSAQLRTNVLFAVTGGLAAMTAVTAVFFVRWRSGDTSVRVGLTPGGVALVGALP